MDTQEPLDRDELLAFAEQAINAEDHEQAVGYLKRALRLDPDDAMALYVLATIHASLGMQGRAVEELLRVLELEPEFYVARFQLGLIFLANGDGEGVLEHWAPFQELPQDDTFYLFRLGIEHYLNDRDGLAVQVLSQAVEQNTAYLSIKDDMQNIRDEIAASDID